MDDARLREIESRLADATKGPWEIDPVEYSEEYWIDYVHWNICSHDNSIAFGVTDKGDALIISHSWQDITDLLAEVKRLRSVTLCEEIQKRDATIAEQVNRIYELERRIAELEGMK